MAKNLLDFEKPLVELENKIQELVVFGKEKNIDLSEEIKTLQLKAENLKKEIYDNLTPWQRVQIARHPERPNAGDYIQTIFDGFMELHGDRYYGDDQAIIGGIAKLDGRPVTVIGEIKGKDTKENLARNFGMPHPEGYRKALRLMEQAEKFGRPIFTFVDTSGAYCGIGAEERGQARAIAVNLTRMMSLKVPVIVTVIGEGGSGGALAIAVGDHITILENAVYSVSSPEALSTILWKDASKAQDAARIMKMSARDLKALGVVDEIVNEPLGGAHKDPQVTAANLKVSLLNVLDELQGLPVETLLQKRYEKFRSIGQFISG